ncbi:MAG: HNH endonuclease signature motif containing protein [Phycisphaeraceae bacterium]
MRIIDVPPQGTLVKGEVYPRDQIHERFGGNPQQGIVPCKIEPCVLLFHSSSGQHSFYDDGFDETGIYWYSGMGTTGDMTWNSANKAVRDHQEDGKDLLFFEHARRKGGLWRYCGERICVGHRIETRIDSTGSPRDAIQFALIDSDGTSSDQQTDAAIDKLDFDSLRSLALQSDPEASSIASRVVSTRHRSAAVKKYALLRANGTCEACKKAAPFKRPNGSPFLEVHHIKRLADSGLDRPDRVAAICPNCHRRCHYSEDGNHYNSQLEDTVNKKEKLLTDNFGS